jgi:hypothetical protein
MIDVDGELDFFPTNRDECIMDSLEIRSNESKKIGRLPKWVIPLDKVSPLGKCSLRYFITIREKEGKSLVCLYPNPKNTHHIRSIKKIGDMTESHGFILCRVESARIIEPFERGIFFW